MVSNKEQRSIPPGFGFHDADDALEEAPLAPSRGLEQIEAEYCERRESLKMPPDTARDLQQIAKATSNTALIAGPWMLIHDVSGRTGDSRYLLFLDVDGVLHPIGADYSFSSKFFSHLPLLEELLREFRSVDIVISSDWRMAESVEQLQRYFTADIRHRIIGATPQMDPNVAVRHRRQLEIQAWLDGNGRSDAEWVALDDWPGSFEASFERLVLTDPQRAFDQDSFQELRAHFLRFAIGRCFVAASPHVK